MRHVSLAAILPRLYGPAISLLIMSIAACHVATDGDAPPPPSERNQTDPNATPDTSTTPPSAPTPAAANTVQGKVQGFDFAVKSALYAQGQAQGFPTVVVYLSDQDKACDAFTKEPNSLVVQRSSASVRILTYDIDPKSGAQRLPKLDTYPAVGTDAAVPAGPRALLRASVVDDKCNDRVSVAEGTASAGQVVFKGGDVRAGGALEGTFSVKVGKQATPLAGNFTASPCPALLQYAEQARCH